MPVSYSNLNQQIQTQLTQDTWEWVNSLSISFRSNTGAALDIPSGFGHATANANSSNVAFLMLGLFFWLGAVLYLMFRVYK